MSRLKFFIFFCLCFLFTLCFYNCAPLTEQGNFKETDINVFNSENLDTTQSDENNDTEDEDDNQDEEPSPDSTEDDADEDEEEEEGEEDDDEPIGEEFDGSETPESGRTPITRGLY
jgi:hypothetical protein